MVQEPYTNPFTQFLAPDVRQVAEEGHRARVNEVERSVERSKRQMEYYSRPVATGVEGFVSIETPASYALQEVELVPPVMPKPEEIGPSTIVPRDIAQPTARLIGDNGDGMGSPWTTGPRAHSVVFIAPVMGAMLVTMGKRVLLAIAYAGAQEVGQRLLYQATRDGIDRNVKAIFRTGKGHGRGRYVRPRPASGEMAGQDSDPYDNEDSFRWFNPWTWF